MARCSMKNELLLKHEKFGQFLASRGVSPGCRPAAAVCRTPAAGPRARPSMAVRLYIIHTVARARNYSRWTMARRHF